MSITMERTYRLGAQAQLSVTGAPYVKHLALLLEHAETRLAACFAPKERHRMEARASAALWSPLRHSAGMPPWPVAQGSPLHLAAVAAAQELAGAAAGEGPAMPSELHW